MTDRDPDEDLSALVAELVTALRDVEEELEPPSEPRLRPPTPRELRRFTSEVAIPGMILVLVTNIRALRLLQRALELSETADRTRAESEAIGERARTVSVTTLEKLDGTLRELEQAVEGRPDSDEAARLLQEARSMRDEVQSRLTEATDPARTDGEDGPSALDAGDADRGGPEVDVDAELESIKSELDDRNGAGTDGQGETDDEEPHQNGAPDGDSADDTDDRTGE
jgi:hypothetical protein